MEPPKHNDKCGCPCVRRIKALNRVGKAFYASLVGISVGDIMYMLICLVTPALIQCYLRTSRVGGHVTLTSPPYPLVLISRTLSRAPHIKVCRVSCRFHTVVVTRCFTNSICWKPFWKFKRVITQSSSSAGQVILRAKAWLIGDLWTFIIPVTIRGINLSVTSTTWWLSKFLRFDRTGLILVRGGRSSRSVALQPKSQLVFNSQMTCSLKS